uniref:Peptidase S54 rhomboid domain-containing protein n=1 Tax=Naja naja TaxID=35670 RepID=A0A8C6XWP6_NAJNA
MVPWATLALVATNVAFFCWPVHPPSETCLSVQSVWGRGQWGRLLWAPFHHLGLCHLLLNMGTLFWLGWGLEQEVGSLRTGALLLALALLGGLMHLGLNALLALVTGSCWYWEHCAVGFSARQLVHCPGGWLGVATVGVAYQNFWEGRFSPSPESRAKTDSSGLWKPETGPLPDFQKAHFPPPPGPALTYIAWTLLGGAGRGREGASWLVEIPVRQIR